MFQKVGRIDRRTVILNQVQGLIDFILGSCAAPVADDLDGLALALIADVRVVFVSNLGLRTEDGKQSRLGDTCLSTKTGEAVPKRVEAVHGHFLFSARDLNGGFEADPADRPERINVDEVVADVFSLGIGFVVACGTLGRDVLVAFPFLRLNQGIVKFRSHRDGHFFARFELLHPDATFLHVDILPLEQDAVFEALSGEHTDDIHDAHFGFVHELVLRSGVRQHGKQRFFLFFGKRLTMNDGTSFLTLASQQRP